MGTDSRIRAGGLDEPTTRQHDDGGRRGGPISGRAARRSRIRDLGPLAAAAFLATIPSLVIFAVIQKRITGGMPAGAVTGVRIPTPERPWSWEEFREVAKELSGDGKYGVAWPLKEPVSATLNLSLSAGGQVFHRGADGKAGVRFDEADQVVPRTINAQVNTDKSASRTTLGSGGSDTLPGFFGGKYAMVPLGFSYRQ